MRCSNCGWPNKPGVTECVKCNTPLGESIASSTEYRSPAGGTGNDSNLNKTVMENDVFGSSQNQYGAPQGGDEPNEVCPKCGYPVRPGTDKCPNCRYDIYANRSARQNPAETYREPGYKSGMTGESQGGNRATRMASADDTHKPVRGTINPYMMNVENEPLFRLKPIKRVEERHDLETLEYEGKEVVLNRDNTEVNNPSITSRQQAVITNEDGKWYIKDLSDQKTTFVQAGEKLELKDGDIILMGNRLFEFHTEK